MISRFVSKYHYTGIVCMDKNCLIGIHNQIPWKCKSDMRFFQSKTSNVSNINNNYYNILICGRKTLESMPLEKMNMTHRKIIVFSKSQSMKGKPYNYPFILGTVSSFLEMESILEQYKNKIHNIFVIGGSQIYNLFLEHDLIQDFYITILNEAYKTNHNTGNIYFDFTKVYLWSSEIYEMHNDCIIYKFKNPLKNNSVKYIDT